MRRRPNQKDISEQDKERLIALYERNVPITHIAREINPFRGQVYIWIHRYIEEVQGLLRRHRIGRCGRKKVLSAEQTADLLNYKQHQLFASSRSADLQFSNCDAFSSS
ncbi:hypothetical protein ILUMI_15144, partial [Ignelater luminosus]